MTRPNDEDENLELWLIILVPALAILLAFGLMASQAGAPGGPGHDVDLTKIEFPEPFDGPAAKTEILEGGLIVEDFVIGTGEPVVKGAKIDIHYTGYLLDGVVFDSSVARNKPISIPIGMGRVIKGWDRGVPGMKLGGKRRLIIPADLAYGERARGKIPSNATLVFTLELVAVAPH